MDFKDIALLVLIVSAIMASSFAAGFKSGQYKACKEATHFHHEHNHHKAK